MTSKLTRAQLHERARENVKALKMASRQTAFESAREEILADLQLAELALAAMDSEPVAYISKSDFDAGYPHILARRDFNKACTMAVYAAQPAPEYPETLPCPVLLEPGMRFGKGVKTRLVLDAIQRRAEHHAELEAMAPEERAEYDAGIEAFKAMLPQPALVVPDEIKHRIGGLDWGWEGEFNRGWNACRAAMLQELQKSAGAEVICRSNENVQALNTIKATPALGSLPKTDEVQNTNSPVIPDGYVMVPVEPNGDMLAAAQDAYGETDGDIANTLRAAMLAAAPQSPGSEPATAPGKWIPVSERMPEDSGRYWCYVEEQNDLGKSHYQWNCSWNGDRWWVESEGGGIVTHWMPLPAAPQEVNRE